MTIAVDLDVKHQFTQKEKSRWSMRQNDNKIQIKGGRLGILGPWRNRSRWAACAPRQSFFATD